MQAVFRRRNGAGDKFPFGCRHSHRLAPNFKSYLRYRIQKVKKLDFKIRLIPDQYHLPDVGRLDAGAQFWIDLQLQPESESVRDFVATYVFDDDGVLIWYEIDDLGLRSDPNARRASEVIEQQKTKLGASERADIWVYPFSVTAHGSTFGLVVRPPEPENDETEEGPLVDAMPGWTLMFYPPWEEGMYDT